MKGRLLVLLVLLLSACSLALSFTVWKTEKKPVQKGCRRKNASWWWRLPGGSCLD